MCVRDPRVRTQISAVRLGPGPGRSYTIPVIASRMRLYTHTRHVPLPSALEAAVVDSFDRIKSALPPLISYQRLGNDRAARSCSRAARIGSILILPDYTRRYAKRTRTYVHARMYNASTPREPAVPLNLNGRNKLDSPRRKRRERVRSCDLEDAFNWKINRRI